MQATPLTPADIHNHRRSLIVSMQMNFRPASYLTEQDERGDLRAAVAMVDSWLIARARYGLCY